MGRSLLQWVKLLGFNKSKLIKVPGTKNIFFFTPQTQEIGQQEVNSAKMRPVSSHVCFSLVSGSGSGEGKRGRF